jgi:hypothetical protein
MSRHVHRLMRVSTVHVSCYVMALEVLYRAVCYQLQSASKLNGSESTLNSVEYLSEHFVASGLTVMRILAQIGKAEGVSSLRRMRALAIHSARLLRVMVSLSRNIFKSESDALRVIYELARHAGKLNALFRTAQKAKDATVCQEIAPLVEVALSLAAKVGTQGADAHSVTSPITVEEAFGIITESKDVYQLEQLRISGNFQRFSESSGQGSGEKAFFDCFVNELIADCDKLYLDSSSDAYYHVFRQELEFLERHQEHQERAIRRALRNTALALSGSVTGSGDTTPISTLAEVAAVDLIPNALVDECTRSRSDGSDKKHDTASSYSRDKVCYGSAQPTRDTVAGDTVNLTESDSVTVAATPITSIEFESRPTRPARRGRAQGIQ